MGTWLRPSSRLIAVGFLLAALMGSFGLTGLLSTTVGAAIPERYDFGTPALTDIWVDPVNGSDQADGRTRATAFLTLDLAWRQIPMDSEFTTTGFRILITPGTVAANAAPSYWEARLGTAEFPVIIQAADGPGSVFLPNINAANVRYLYLIDLHLVGEGGDVFHCERCDYLLLRRLTIIGGDPATGSVQEAVKINQSRHIYIEESNISGAWDNAVDLMAVQYGHIVASTIHAAGDWCLYVKGGSAYIRIEANRVFNCGTGGITAGQGSGLEFMETPWVHHEAYDIKIVNNVVHDTEGAGLGVNGGYNVLLAFNTLYRVGARSHALEIVHGTRSCDGNVKACAERIAVGGWGVTNEGGQWIPNRTVFVFNNVIYNPTGYQTNWQHLMVAGPRTPPEGSNVPVPALADANLVIRGNVIWNGPGGHPLGIEEDEAGCRPWNSTCNEGQLRAENAINTVEPLLIDPDNGDFRPQPGGPLVALQAVVTPDFTWDDAPSQPATPVGMLSNTVTHDRNGVERGAQGPPGAYR